MRMRILFATIAAAIVLGGPCFGQIVVPATPGKFKPRPTGGGSSPGVEVIPKEPKNPTARYTTHVVLSESRIWSAIDGRTLEGKLIAFEDLVVETPKGAAEPAIPPRPAKPTVVRSGKARLLVGKKPFEIELTKLNPADRDFIRQIETSIAKQADTPKTP